MYPSAIAKVDLCKARDRILGFVVDRDIASLPAAYLGLPWTAWRRGTHRTVFSIVLPTEIAVFLSTGGI
jgi:hypothetical protein